MAAGGKSVGRKERIEMCMRMILKGKSENGVLVLQSDDEEVGVCSRLEREREEERERKQSMVKARQLRNCKHRSIYCYVNCISAIAVIISRNFFSSLFSVPTHNSSFLSLFPFLFF